MERCFYLFEYISRENNERWFAWRLQKQNQSTQPYGSRFWGGAQNLQEKVRRGTGPIETIETHQRAVGGASAGAFPKITGILESDEQEGSGVGEKRRNKRGATRSSEMSEGSSGRVPIKEIE